MSVALGLMEYAQAKGIGKIGETLFLVRAFNEDQNTSIYLFSEPKGGEFMRVVRGDILYETVIADISVIGLSPEDCDTRLRQLQVELDKMKGHKDKDYEYEAVLALSPPRFVTTSGFGGTQSRQRYIYAQPYKVMRKYIPRPE